MHCAHKKYRIRLQPQEKRREAEGHWGESYENGNEKKKKELKEKGEHRTNGFEKKIIFYLLISYFEPFEIKFSGIQKAVC